MNINIKVGKLFKGEDMYPGRKNAFKDVFALGKVINCELTVKGDAINVLYNGDAIGTILNEEASNNILTLGLKKITSVKIDKKLSPAGNTEFFYGIVESEDLEEGSSPLQALITVDAWNKIFEDAMPSYEDQSAYIPSGSTAFIGDNYMRKALYSIAAGDNILFIGPMAAGKNTLIDYLAAQIGRPEYELQCSSGAMEENFLGEYVLTMSDEIPNKELVNAQFKNLMSVLKGNEALKPQDILDNSDFSVLADAIRSKSAIMEFRKGPLVMAMENGAWFVADEINFTNPSILGLCNSVLDNRRRINVPNYGLVEAKPGFRFFGTMNRGYLGTNSLNAATRSRFVSIPVDAPKSISGFLDCDAKAKNVLETVYQKMKTMDADINIRAFVAVTKHLKMGRPLSDAISIIYESMEEEEQIKAIEQICRNALS